MQKITLSSNDIKKTKRNGKNINTKKILFALFFIILGTVSTLVLLLNPSEPLKPGQQEYFDQSVDNYEVEETVDILFIGHMYSHVDNHQDILDKLSLLNFDIVVYGGDSVYKSSDEYISTLEDLEKYSNEIFEQTIFVRGNHDTNSKYFNDRDNYGSYIFEGVQNIYLDTTLGPKSYGCELGEEQEQFLKDTLNQEARVRIIYTHHPWWIRGGYIEGLRQNAQNPNECNENYWAEKIVPLIRDKVDLVVSGDSGIKIDFNIREKDGIKYLLNGLDKFAYHPNYRPEIDTKLMTFSRIRIDETGEIIIDDVRMSDSNLVNMEILDELPTYNVTIKEDSLTNIYKISPMYNFQTGWTEMIESYELEDVLLSKVPGEMEYNNKNFDIEIGVRGNVGNHWKDIKKSWTINSKDDEFRQIKLVIPSDRRYLNQIFIQRLTDQMGHLTPDVTLARLIINGIDFGIYLQFEDFDKAFIELAGYNSDAAPSKNLFLDKRNRLTDISVDQKGNDNSYQQNIHDIEMTSEEINRYFDRDTFARWLAIQIITGDRHQSLNDNFRFFIDKSTGKYIVVTWDVMLRRIESKDTVLSNLRNFQNAFLEDQTNYKLTMNHVQKFIENSDIYRELLLDTYDSNTKYLLEDTFPEKREVEIRSMRESVLDDFDHNLEMLKLFLEETKSAEK